MNSSSGIILVSVRFSCYDHSLIALEVKAKAGCSISWRRSCWEGEPKSRPWLRSRSQDGRVSVWGAWLLHHGCFRGVIRELKCGKMACSVQKLAISHMLSGRVVSNRTVKPRSTPLRPCKDGALTQLLSSAACKSSGFDMGAHPPSLCPYGLPSCSCLLSKWPTRHMLWSGRNVPSASGLLVLQCSFDEVLTGLISAAALAIAR